MRFARITFAAAGVWGLLVLLPLYTARGQLTMLGSLRIPPALADPQFFYGFLAVAVVWQLGFLVVATDPVRYRAFIPLALLEKAVFVTTLVLLAGHGRITPIQLAGSAPDAVLAILFAAAWFLVRERVTLPLAGRAKVGG